MPERVSEGVNEIILFAKGDIPGISKNHILDHKIYLPNRKTQDLVVAKIEELFSELDKGIESLKTAREQLKIYRQALLKHAFEGKLTEQWRKENSDKLETADTSSPVHPGYQMATNSMKNRCSGYR